MNILIKIVSLTLFSFLFLGAQAQATASTETNFMYANGKIFVVMAVVIFIVAGLFIYLFSLDKKISRLERNKD